MPQISLSSPRLTSSLRSSFSRSSACLSLSFCWASSFSLCRLSCCSCCGFRGATWRGDPGGADPRTAAAGRCPVWTAGRAERQIWSIQLEMNVDVRSFQGNTHCNIYLIQCSHDMISSICHLRSHVLILKSI